jgi:thymidylate kinase
MLIEFLGAPGTGKTTLARALAEDLRARGYDATVVSMDAPANLGRYAKAGRDLIEIGPWLAANPGQVWRSIALMRRFPQRNWTSALLRLRYWLRALARAERGAKAAALVILDQGCFQGLASWALYCTRLDASALRAVLPTLPSPELLVVLTLPEDAIRARLRHRNHAHRKIDNLLLADDRWIGASAASVAQVEEAARDGGLAVLRLCSSSFDTIATLTERVLSVLAENAPASAVQRS